MSENRTGNVRPSWTRRDAILMSAETILFIASCIMLSLLQLGWPELAIVLGLDRAGDRHGFGLESSRRF
jgi:hypothetical protein